MNIHRTSYLSGGTSGKSLRSKQRAPRSLIDGAIRGTARLGMAPSALKPRVLLGNEQSIDGVGSTRVDVDASTVDLHS